MSFVISSVRHGETLFARENEMANRREQEIRSDILLRAQVAYEGHS